MEDEAKLREYLTGADMIFITAGMGGGTGTGARR
jgi:cell division protein FtsZ